MPTISRVRKTSSNEDATIKRFREIFPAIDPPAGGMPTVMGRVSSITTDKLGDLINRYNAWREFTEDLHLEAVARWGIAKDAYDFEVSKGLAVAGKSADSVTLAKAKAKMNPEVLALGEAYGQATMFKDMVAKKLESLNNVLATLSRELTRRGFTNI